MEGARLHYKIGLGVARLGRSAEAVEWFRRAATLGPDVVDHNWRYAVELDRSGRPDEVLAFLEKALVLDPSDARVLAALDGVRRRLDRSQGDAVAAE